MSMTIRRSQRGSMLIQLMLGVTVGLVVILAVTQFFVTQISSNREVLLATRLNQELRTIMDLVVHDLRRTAYWENAISGVWYEGTPGVQANPLQSITIANSVDASTTTDPVSLTSGDTLTYSYDVNADGALNAATDSFTIRLNNSVVELVQNGNAVPLSDSTSTTITGLTFGVRPSDVIVSCVLTGSNPTLTVREVTITLAGRLAGDANVTRTLQETVRMRGDRIAGSCPLVIT